MEQQREMARAARKSDDEIAWQDEELGFFTADDATEFTGYDTLNCKGYHHKKDKAGRRDHSRSGRQHRS